MMGCAVGKETVRQPFAAAAKVAGTAGQQCLPAACSCRMPSAPYTPDPSHFQMPCYPQDDFLRQCQAGGKEGAKWGVCALLLRWACGCCSAEDLCCAPASQLCGKRSVSWQIQWDMRQTRRWSVALRLLGSASSAADSALPSPCPLYSDKGETPALYKSLAMR